MSMRLAYAGDTDSVWSSYTPVSFTVTDHELATADLAAPANMRRFASPLSIELTQEYLGAAEYLSIDAEILLVAALGRTMERVFGPGRTWLDVMVANERTGNWLAAVRRLQLPCISAGDLPANDMLATVAEVLAAPGAEPADGCDVLFSYGTAPLPDNHPGPAHALELRAHRGAQTLQLDWWFDAQLVDDYTAEELAEQFPLALIELATEATPVTR